MRLYITNEPLEEGILNTYTIKVNSLIGKKTICYVIADEFSFYNFISANFNNIVAVYNYTEYSSKNDLYRYSRHVSYKQDIRIKFTKYMTFLIWKRRNINIDTFIRYVHSPIVSIKNAILKFKTRNKLHDFEEFYNK